MEPITYYLTKSQDGKRFYYKPEFWEEDGVDGLPLNNKFGSAKSLPADYPAISLLPMDADPEAYPQHIIRVGKEWRSQDEV